MSLLDRLPAPKQTQALSRWEQEDEGSLALAEAPTAPEQSVLGKARSRISKCLLVARWMWRIRP